MLIPTDLQRMDMKLSMPYNPCSIPFSLNICALWSLLNPPPAPVYHANKSKTTIFYKAAE